MVKTKKRNPYAKEVMTPKYRQRKKLSKKTYDRKKYKSVDGKPQSVLWTVYHTILAVELGMLVVIEALELFDWWGWIV